MATDRRTGIRFEIVGRLRGTLATEPSVHLLNISRGGALIEAPWMLPVDSVQVVRLDSDQHFASVEARVCHARQGYTDHRYQMGLEFLGADGEVGDQVDRVLSRQMPSDVEST